VHLPRAVHPRRWPLFITRLAGATLADPLSVISGFQKVSQDSLSVIETRRIFTPHLLYGFHHIHFRHMTRYDSPKRIAIHICLLLAGPRDNMKVICAWCEREGKLTLIGEVELYDRKMTSHGICPSHERLVLKQVQHLSNRENARFQKRRLSRTKLSSSIGLPISRTTHMRTSTRHRLLKDHLSAAQLQLPFSGF
jgi:hypothetical protein